MGPVEAVGEQQLPDRRCLSEDWNILLLLWSIYYKMAALLIKISDMLSEVPDMIVGICKKIEEESIIM